MKVINVILGILISVKLQILHCYEEEFKEASFIFVNGMKSTDSYVVVQFNDTKSLLKHPDFHQHRNTILFCHGYTESYTANTTQEIVDAYLWRNDHNILVVQWSSYAAGNYVFEAIPNAIKVSVVVNILCFMGNKNFIIFSWEKR